MLWTGTMKSNLQVQNRNDKKWQLIVQYKIKWKIKCHVYLPSDMFGDATVNTI